MKKLTFCFKNLSNIIFYLATLLMCFQNVVTAKLIAKVRQMNVVVSAKINS